MASPVLKKFGRYFILDALSSGGMAEVFTARRIDNSPSSPIIAIKQIGEKDSRDESFVKMFSDEINTMMGLSHPNIVQLHDYGMQDGKPFIVMEFIFGVSLRDLIVEMRELRMPPPVSLAIHIAEQVAAGLSYAHNFKNQLSNLPLKIVHRDITPRNIVISYDGLVKIIDFGVAKTINTEQTKTGIIKGNLAYLSPELVSRGDPDCRTDIFSLGLVLWELLVGRRFFQTENMSELAMIKQIDSVDDIYQPPSVLRPDLPRELDEIVGRAIQKNREKRYQNAEEFQIVLRRFLQSTDPDFTSSQAKNMLDKLFAARQKAERRHLRDLNNQATEIMKAVPNVDRVTQQSFAETKIISPEGVKRPVTPPVLSADKRPVVPELRWAGSPHDSGKAYPPRLRKVSLWSRINHRRIAAILFLGLLSATELWEPEVEREISSVPDATPTSVVNPSPASVPIANSSVAVAPGVVSSAKVEVINPNGLLTWLHSENLKDFKAGEKVGLWKDDSGTIDRNDVVQPDPSFQPKANRDGVSGFVGLEFDGKGTFILANKVAKRFKALTEFSLSAVVRSRGNESHSIFSCYYWNRETEVFRFGFSGLKKLSMFANGAQYLTAKLINPASEVGVYTLLVKSDRIEVYVNGVFLKRFEAKKLSFQNTEYCTIGQDYDQGAITDVFDGFLFEMAVYDHWLSPEEREAIDQNFTSRYLRRN